MLKQRSEDNDWRELLRKCDKEISVGRLMELEQKAIRDIRKAVKSCKCAYGYSGGKDSVVLSELIKKSMVDIPCFCTIRHEYPEMERFIKLTAPSNTSFIYADDFSMDYLNNNPDYLFPEETAKKIRSEYTKHWRIHAEKFLKRNGIQGMITGRRLEDGNYCGKYEDGLYMSQNKNVKSFNVIADWTHLELLAYMKVNKLPFAPIYNYPNGFVFGTHMWIERDRIEHSIEKTFDEVWKLDKTIVINAAKAGLIEAQKYISKQEG